MHELSIAQNIVDTIKSYVNEDDLLNVNNVRIKLGEMSGVIADSLEFSFQAITDRTPLSNARLLIEHIPFVLRCNSCNKETTNEFGMRMCSACFSLDTEIISGLELQVVDLELENNVINQV